MLGNIVVISADDASRKLWREQLEARGWKVGEARDARSAMSLVMREQPQVIVTAVQLPDASRHHFVRGLRSAVDHDVKMIGVGALSGDARYAGFDLLVQAPIDFDSLHRAIARSNDNDLDDRRPTRKIRVKKPDEQ